MRQINNSRPRDCTICGKNFASGKAMGGHMRTHFVNHPTHAVAMIKKKAVENSAEFTHDHAGENFMLDSSASSESSSQWKSLTGTRSKRRRKLSAAEKEDEAEEAEEEKPVSSEQDPEVQHAAEILMDIHFSCRRIENREADMSSRRIELTKGEPRLSVNLLERQENNVQLNEFQSAEEANVLIPEKPLGLFQALVGASHTDSRFNPPISNKIFRSNQFLSLHNEKDVRVQASKMPFDLFQPPIGGTCTKSGFNTNTCHQPLSFHRESHKELQSKMEDNEYYDSGIGGSSGSNNDAIKNEKRHQCPVCFKMFASGQGLGGHKRVHMASAAAKVNNPSATQILRPTLDLNLPPPEFDEEVISISDLSTSSSEAD